MKITFVLSFLVLSCKISFCKSVEIKGKVFYNNVQKINVKQWSQIAQTNILIAETNILEDKSFNLTFELSEPGLYVLNGNQIFLNPNSSYHIDYKSINDFEVKAENPGDILYFNYFINVEKPNSRAIMNREELISFSNDLIEDSLNFEVSLKEFYTNYTCSENFKEFIRDYNKAFYIQSIFNAMERLKINMNDSYFKKYIKIEFSKYFKKPVSNSFYGYFLLRHSKFIENINHNPQEISDIEALLSIYEVNYSHQDALSLKIRLFHYLCINPNITSFGILNKLYLELIQKLEPEFNVSPIKKKYEDLILNETIIENYYLEDKIFDRNKNISSFEKLFESKKDSLIIIDFWASWCGPCIIEFPAISKKRIDFKDSKVAFVTINLDTDLGKWDSECLKYNLLSNSFFLEKGFSSKFGEKFLTNGIPKIMIFNSRNKLISQNFIQPSNPRFNDELKKLINKM